MVNIILSMPAQFFVTGSPVDPSVGGTFGVTWQLQSPNLVWAGPTSGGAAAPTFRALVLADIPSGGGSPLTTKGDLYGFDVGNARVPISSDTYVLTGDSSQALGLKWAPVPACVNSLNGSQGVLTLIQGGLASVTVSTVGAAITLDAVQDIRPTSTPAWANLIAGQGDNTSSVTAGNVRGPAVTGSNAAGCDLTLQSGNGTGTGGSGHLKLQTAPPGSSGASANTFHTGGDLDPKGNFALGLGTVTTSATDGFPYVSSCAGTPTGTPTSVSGFIPLVVDSTNNLFYFYSGGAWQTAGGISGIVPLVDGGTGADMSATGPGAVVQSTGGSVFSIDAQLSLAFGGTGADLSSANPGVVIVGSPGGVPLATMANAAGTLLNDGSGNLSWIDPDTGSYTPTTPTDWNGTAPTSIREGLDRCATLLKTLNGGTGP